MSREKFMDALIGTGLTEVSRKDIKKICSDNNISFPHWFTNDSSNRISHGRYAVPSLACPAKVVPIDAKARIESLSTDIDLENLIPAVYENYVPFGNFNDILKIVESKKFFPVFISGHSGNGKTMSVEQACAKAKRKFVIVSMTKESDESDLLGNYVLVNGNMVWRDGPVTTAARQGAVLCIDEIDYGAQNLSCLQRVLEGKPFMLKKKGELVTPVEGFTIFATANTKGKGSDDGRYMFTNILNEAFLERFRNTMDQSWPSVAIETKILKNELKSVGIEDNGFVTELIKWANIIRDTFTEGACDEVITTRRLVHIVETYSIFNDKIKALTLCLNRFDDDTRASFIDLYVKIDQAVNSSNGDGSNITPIS